MYGCTNGRDEEADIGTGRRESDEGRRLQRRLEQMEGGVVKAEVCLMYTGRLECSEGRYVYEQIG